VEHFLYRMTLQPQVVYLTALTMIVGAARRCAPSPDAPGSERGHHVDDIAWNRLVVVREEHPEACTRLLGRDSFPPIFAGSTAVEHRVVTAVAYGDAVDRRPVRWEVVWLPLKYLKDGVTEVFVGLVVCRSSDLIVLLGDVLGFLEDLCKVSVGLVYGSQNAPRSSGGAENLTN